MVMVIVAAQGTTSLYIKRDDYPTVSVWDWYETLRCLHRIRIPQSLQFLH